MTAAQTTLTILIFAGATLLTRALPFALFPNAEKTPGFVKYLGRVLPSAMMGMLIVYCVKNVDLTAGAHGLPELVAIAMTGLCHVWKKNMMLSIAVGTAVYMVLIRVIPAF